MGLFVKNRIIYSNLKKAELIDKLTKSIEPFKRDGSKYLFEGKMEVNGNFIIYPTFDYHARNQIRPEINGVINSLPENGSQIDIIFNLPSGMKGLIGVVIFVNLVACLFLYFNDLFLKWYVLLSFIIVFCLIAYSIYYEKVKKSLDVLCRILK
jgi:hypothetical protein